MYDKNVLGMRPCTWVYLLLLLFTTATFLVGEMELEGLGISLLVLLLALLKGQLVGYYFMGLGEVKGLWHWPVFIWLFVPGALISTAFYFATQG